MHMQSKIADQQGLTLEKSPHSTMPSENRPQGGAHFLVTAHELHVFFIRSRLPFHATSEAPEFTDF